MIYTERITISKEVAELVNRAVDYEPESAENVVLGEDDMIVYDASFPNGYSMDIKCCGVKFEPDTTNKAWTEAVLFNKNGAEVACSDVEDWYIGRWELENDGITYIVDVGIA